MKTNAVRPIGFSLLEVIIAAGIFAGTVTVAIALLAGLAQQAGEVKRSLTARSLPDAVAVELQRLAADGFDALAARIPMLSPSLEPGFELVATQDGGGVQSPDYHPPALGRLPTDEQFYLVECWQYPDAPLRFESTKAYLALHVRISWPNRLPGLAKPLPLADRNQLSFTVCLNR